VKFSAWSNAEARLINAEGLLLAINAGSRNKIRWVTLKASGLCNAFSVGEIEGAN